MMNKFTKTFFAFLCAFCFLCFSAPAQTVYQVDLKEEIGFLIHWEIGIFVIGVVLLLLEVFVIPGFGVAGILGIIAILSALALAMVDHNFFDFIQTSPELLMLAVLIVIGVMLLAIVLMVIFGKNILRSRVFKRLVLVDEQQAGVGYTSSPLKANLLLKNGIARTVLRPGGKIEIDGVWHDAVALDGFIEAGEEVYVEKHENYNLFVRKLKDKPNA